MLPKLKSYNRLLDEHLHILITQGNHEAYLRLAKRYKKYFEGLTCEIIEQYPKSGVSFKEIMAICGQSFPEIVKKYDSSRLSCFFIFWRETCLKGIMDYLLENSYLANAAMFRGFVTFDEELDERRCASDRLAEFDDNHIDTRRVEMLRRLINEHKDEFKNHEFAILTLMLDGYDLNELEHTGIISKSYLYLTFIRGVEKLKKYFKLVKK